MTHIMNNYDVVPLHVPSKEELDHRMAMYNEFNRLVKEQYGIDMVNEKFNPNNKSKKYRLKLRKHLIWLGTNVINGSIYRFPIVSPYTGRVELHITRDTPNELKEY